MKVDFNHHAYLIERESENRVLGALKKVGIEKAQNPDFLMIDEESFSIGSARGVRDFQSKKAFSGGKKIIFIRMQRATREAQNALLKTLEEPTQNTYFFILVPSRDVLLPTVFSRLEILEFEKKGEDDNFKKFLKSPLKKRLFIVDEIVKEKNKREAEELIDNILSHFKKDYTKEEQEYLNKVLEIKKYLRDRSPNLKQILEYAVINFPE